MKKLKNVQVFLQGSTWETFGWSSFIIESENLVNLIECDKDSPFCQGANQI